MKVALDLTPAQANLLRSIAIGKLLPGCCEAPVEKRLWAKVFRAVKDARFKEAVAERKPGA